MRAKNIMLIGFTAGLVVLWMGCGGERTTAKNGATSPRGRRGAKCAHDTDCMGGFCNLGQCVDYVYRHYGGACPPPDPYTEPYQSLPENLCHDGYLCLDGRCRSCQSDAECQAYFGTGKCIAVNGPTWQQGAACFPNTTRAARGATCVEDTDCQSLFCDRGTCASKRDLDRWTYHLACTPGPVRPLTKTGSNPPEGTCEGHLCIDQRCRSCASDEECQRDGASELRCLPVPNWPGKLCVMPSVAQDPPPAWGNPFVKPPPPPSQLPRPQSKG